MKLVAIAYPASLIVVVLIFRWVGERWWATGVALYLPRLGFAVPLPFIVAGLLVLRLWRLLYTQLLAALIVLFPLMGFVLPTPHFADDEAPRIRVLSYNVDSLNGGIDNVLAQIEKFSPDLVFLQEVYSDQEVMVERLRTRYPSVGTSAQFVFASRFPVISTEQPERVEFGGKLRTARFAKQVIETPLGPIAFYNVHPVSPREGLVAVRGEGVSHEVLTGRVFAARSTAMQEGSALRELQIKAFADMAKQESGPVVIAGDTNLPSQSFFLNHFLSAYSDGFGQAGWGLGYTFPSYRHAWMRIDRIFTSDSLRVVAFEVGQSKASDHYCVVADVQKK